MRLAWLLALMAFGAQAQVFRCTDAEGKLSFSDQPCSRAQRGGAIEIKPQTTPDSSADKQVGAERERMLRQEDVRRRAFYRAREREDADRAALLREHSRKCDNAREQQAYYASRPSFTPAGAHHSQKMVEHWAGEVSRYCQ